MIVDWGLNILFLIIWLLLVDKYLLSSLFDFEVVYLYLLLNDVFYDEINDKFFINFKIYKGILKMDVR